MTQAAADDTSTQASPTPRDSHSGSTVHTYIAAAALGTSRPTVATTTGTTSLTASGTASLTASGTAASPTLPSDNRTQSGANSETTLSGQQPVTVNKSLRLDTSDSDESHVTSSDAAAAVDVSAGADRLWPALPTSTESVIQQDTNSSSAVNSHNTLPGAIQGTDALRTNMSSKTHNNDVNDPGGTSYDINSEANATANDSVPGDWLPVSVLATSTDRHVNDLNAAHHDDTSNTGDNEEQRLPVQVSRHSMTSSGVITAQK